MKLIIKYYQFIHLLIPAIESYPEEYYGLLFGDKTSRTSGNERFIPEFILPSLTAQRRSKEVSPNEKRDERVMNLVSRLADAKYIGDFHSHILKKGYDYDKRPKTLDEVLNNLIYNARYSDYDLKSMEKNRNYIYIITSLFKNKWFAPKQTKKGDLFGSINNFNFLTSAYYWNSRTKKFQKAKVECSYVTGFKGFRKYKP
ncbi:hypothetical protein JW851_00185 [Candidatus Woesearchaeota archaeon]|nr:hypothetical protein [Candidatus Woesearchaeota archaeon]